MLQNVNRSMFLGDLADIMQIFVKSQETFSLDVQPWDTVENVKGQIQEREGKSHEPFPLALETSNEYLFSKVGCLFFAFLHRYPC